MIIPAEMPIPTLTVSDNLVQVHQAGTTHDLLRYIF